ncbi:hypothetical protein B0J13DRAFT_92524 [Dactylonectria estremocensis]|uniref:C2H2-type domain-containing protein n=1 Tax=Dactylonectria estremocensis TaxID=1079267 RepID=A0A9P9ECY5_9HYPO|nr:hypothetical protein B0J13DRAFT_92524 [Dactylonectria estremocensis]
MISLPQQHQQQHQHQQQQQQQQQQQHQLTFQPYSYPTDYYPEYHNAYSPSPIDLAPLDLDDSIAILDHQLPAELMQSEHWGALAQQTPRLARFAHQRESSLSSLASSGAAPASPFAHNSSNPQIAISNASHDGLIDNTSGNGQGSYYHLAKSTGPYQGYQNCGGMEHIMPEMAYPIAISGPSGKPRLDRAFIPAPDFTTGSTRSHPASVASSIAGDSPATPTVGESDISERRRKGFAHVPKLDRTMTDVYNDELFSPNFAITSTPPSQSQMDVSPTNDLFSQRLHAANSQHLSAAHSPASTTSRGRSPFLAGSPLAPSPSHDFGTGAVTQNMPFNTAQQMREHNKAQHEAQLLHQQMTQRAEPETPKTISPKDAILEFTEPDGDSNFPLFPQEPTAFEMDQFSKAMASQSSQDATGHDGGSSQFNYMHSQLPSGIPVPQQYPFVSHSRPSHDTPPRLSSAGSSSTASRTNTPAHLSRPNGTAADGGTYTCTYHGCTLRFETPTLLQKHKREGHRQSQTLGGPRPREIVGTSTSVLNSQAGPHRCDRINPSTGKPCSTVFSRPYDLTRHEDTIHNARKQKVRCNLCTEEKTFSRADALTRHYRVCHPDMELPGKHRRRGGA